jgi:hypothetical protein
MEAAGRAIHEEAASKYVKVAFKVLNTIKFPMGKIAIELETALDDRLVVMTIGLAVKNVLSPVRRHKPQPCHGTCLGVTG